MDAENSAFDAIVRGFARLERGVHPVEERGAGHIRYLHWPERGRRGQEFSEEFFALDRNPAEVLAAVRSAGPGPDHLIAEVAVLTSSHEDAYLSAGYEFGSQEPLMVAALDTVTRPAASGIVVDRVRSLAAVAEILSAQASVNYPARLFSQELLNDNAVRILTIYRDGRFAAIGKMAIVGTAAYITDVMTMPEHRRQGLGEAIMRELHMGATAAGATDAVLTSTSMAKPLYERLGYRQVGTVTIYATPEHH